MLNKFTPAAGPFYQNVQLDGGAKIKRRHIFISKHEQKSGRDPEMGTAELVLSSATESVLSSTTENKLYLDYRTVSINIMW